MNLLQSCFAVKLTVTLKGKDVGPIGPELEGGCWRDAQKHSTFWQRQYLSSVCASVSTLQMTCSCGLVITL